MMVKTATFKISLVSTLGHVLLYVETASQPASQRASQTERQTHRQTHKQTTNKRIEK